MKQVGGTIHQLNFPFSAEQVVACNAEAAAEVSKSVSDTLKDLKHAAASASQDPQVCCMEATGIAELSHVSF